MSEFTDPLFRKLDRIPGAPNFVRYNFEDPAKMLKAYVAFAKGMPTISYAAGMLLIKDLVLGISGPDQIRRAARRLKDSPSKAAVIDFVDAFCDYSSDRCYQATPTYSDLTAYFQIGRDLYAPVKPTLVAREDGQLKPIFVLGWKSIPLTTFQRRLLMTILEDAIFSLTEFQSSDAEIVFLPEMDGVRVPEVWHRGDYNLLSQAEMTDQVELFLSARSAAYPIIADWIKTKRPKPQREQPSHHPDQPRFNL